MVEPYGTLSAGVVSTTDARARCPVTVMVPTASPSVAEIVAVPSSTAVIVAPAAVPVTMATAGALEVHVRDGDGTTRWLASFTTAATARVSPADVIASLDDRVSSTLGDRG